MSKKSREKSSLVATERITKKKSNSKFTIFDILEKFK